MTAKTFSGSCLCGGVQFRAMAPLRDIIGCHCSQCRRVTGHWLPATAVTADRLKLIRRESLVWYRASESAQRGFCGTCGSTLFWRPDSGSHISIVAGCLDSTEGLKLAAHIFVGDKLSYYDLNDGVPQFKGLSGIAIPDSDA